MNDEPLTSLVLYLVSCRALPKQDGLQAAVRHFQQRGGRFLYDLSYKPHPDPCSVVTEKGDARFPALSLQHPSLQPDVYVLHDIATKGLDPANTPGWGNFSYFAGSRTVGIHQRVEFPDEDPLKVERVAYGLLQFLLDNCAGLDPGYAYLDHPPSEYDTETPTDVFEKTGKVRFLCWANYFAPEVVRAVGRGFWEGAPGWRVVDLDGGGLLYVATPSFLEWYSGEHEHLVRYFRTRFPRLQKY